MLKRIALTAALTLAVAAPTAAGDPVAPALKAARERTKDLPSLPGRVEAAADGPLWITLASSDVGALETQMLPLQAPVARSDRAEVYRVSPELLPALSSFMHEKFHRCGGFFAHRSREEAEGDLAAPVRAAAAGPYVMDQRAVVEPLLGRVQESELRSTMDSLAAFHDRFYSSDPGAESARWLQARWQSLVKGLPGASAQAVAHQGWQQPSVVLSIPGAERPDEIVVLGGHLDSINSRAGKAGRAPGADDNASGIAVLTEAVRVLVAAGWRPRRTVEFMGYAAEEVGLRGSQDIAARYARAGRKVVGVIQYDMSAFAGSGHGIFLLTDNVDRGLSAFVGELVDAYAGVPRGETDCGYACSDHASWDKNGFPAAMAFESRSDDMNPGIHTDRDTLAGAGGDAAHAVPFAKLAVAFAVELAKTAQRP
ncbi:MAG: M20/M25/M40 family metallo-hydrolase [Elusimicrobia bacterium]|nr:M20/M25/M40 family metallo-hydrolase [Elusimicrobiota bacterium]